MALVTILASRLIAVAHLATLATATDASIRGAAKAAASGDELHVPETLVRRLEELETLASSETVSTETDKAGKPEAAIAPEATEASTPDEPSPIDETAPVETEAASAPRRRKA